MMSKACCPQRTLTSVDFAPGLLEGAGKDLGLRQRDERVECAVNQEEGRSRVVGLVDRGGGPVEVGGGGGSGLHHSDRDNRPIVAMAIAIEEVVDPIEADGCSHLDSREKGRKAGQVGTGRATGDRHSIRIEAPVGSLESRSSRRH